MSMFSKSVLAYIRTHLNSHPYFPKLTLVFSIIWFASPVSGFMNDGYGHRGITKDALASLKVDLADGKRGFSKNALQDIQSSIATVDLPIWGEFSTNVAHCDDETLPQCFQRVVDKRREVLNLLKREPPEGQQARKVLGQALHTIQDFYSHSNWVHNPGPNKGDINRDFGVTAPKLKLGADRPTCVEGGVWEGNHVLTGDGLTEITTGYFRTGGIPAKKCNHGGPLYRGINKDTDNALEKQLLGKARKFAVTATLVFVEQIFQELQKDERAVLALLEGE